MLERKRKRDYTYINIKFIKDKKNGGFLDEVVVRCCILGVW